MALSVASFVVSVIFTDRLRRFSKLNKLPHFEKLFRNALYIAIGLFAVEALFSAETYTIWMWHLFLVSMFVFVLKQQEFKGLKMFIMAFVPFILVSLSGDLVELVSKELFKSWETYFKSATALSYMWMAAILFSQNRQNKAAEKERIRRQHEDELNRAIAIRKVELEALVAERTAELTRQKEELESTLTELRTTQSQLIQSEKMASLGELTAGIAHEIQNPLNFVNNFSEVSTELLDEMQEEMDKGKTSEAMQIISDLKLNLEKINFHGKRADSIVKGMLLHSRASSGQKEPTDLNALADEYLRLAYHGLRAKDKSFNSKFDAELDPAIGKITIVPQDIGRVMLNLLTNAFYAVSDKKKRLGEAFEPAVSIITKKVGHSVEVRVIDNGDGIPQKDIEKIFQPFFTTKPAGKGTGLGLSMCYEIVTQGHGGELKVETKEGEGSVFSFNLPV